MIRSILIAVIISLVTNCLADPVYDTVDPRDPALMPRSEATFRVQNAVIAKMASCPNSNVGQGLFGVIMSAGPCDQDSLFRSCEQKGRYVKRSEVDDCIYAILLVPCDGEYYNVGGDKLADTECRQLFGSSPLLQF